MPSWLVTILIGLVPAILVAVVTSVITVTLALRRFRQERWWEKNTRHMPVARTIRRYACGGLSVGLGNHLSDGPIFFRTEVAGHPVRMTSRNYSRRNYYASKALIGAQLFKYDVKSRVGLLYRSFAMSRWSGRLSPRASQHRFFLVTQM
jgi:hypothetical protein